MGTSANKILELARAELGVKETPAGSNNVKYNESYYRLPVSGPQYPWCATFVWWLFKRAGAPELYFGGQKTAYVPALLTWARQNDMVVDEPQPGDLICFDFNDNSKADHIGVCERWDGQYITTIDGNTGTTNEANGGCVMRRRRHKKYILAVIRPKYVIEEDEDMDISKLSDEEVLQLAARIDQLRAKQPPSGWSDEAREWAEKNGVVSGDGSSMAYKRSCTREELVQMLYNMEHQ